MQVTWKLDNVERIGGHRAEVLGSPQVVSTPQGPAIAFNGRDEGLLVPALPLQGVPVFTLEAIFYPEDGGLTEQRFVHLQETVSENRMLLETRLTGDGRWYLDTFIRSHETNQTLVDRERLHPVDRWYHVALVVDGHEMRHYVDGVPELAAAITYTPMREGKTSLGVRQNQISWFKGMIHAVRFSAQALSPAEFMSVSR